MSGGGFFWYTSWICFKTLSFDVIRGQCRSALVQSFDLKLTWPYFLCNTAVFSFRLICNIPIFLVIVMLTVIEVWMSIRVFRGLVSSWEVIWSRTVKCLSHMISWDAQLSFDIYVEKQSFEVIRGKWRSAWGKSYDLSLVWTYFHCNTAAFSFQLICNTPTFFVNYYL